MIKTQDLKLQMDELTKQNDMVLIELEQVKKMLISSAQGSQNAQGSQDSQSSQGPQDSQGQNASGDNSNAAQYQSASQNGSQSQSQSQNQNQDQNQNQGQGQYMNSGQGDSKNQQVTDLANELLKIKDLVIKLEQKTSQYVSSQSGGSLTEKDAVNLILTLMNGMVDWASEFVSSKAGSNGQLQ
ncbi:hypothetical protein D3C85_915970 [compost metagenome]